MAHCRFRPTFHVSISEDDGSLSYEVDWSDANEGMYDDEDGDGIGYEGATEHWEALMRAMERVPALLGYPYAYVAGNMVDVAGDGVIRYARLEAPQAPQMRATCSFYSPSQQMIDEEGAVPLESWPFGKHYPYGVCTNPQMVGQGGFGPCRYDHRIKMSSCQVYSPEIPVRRGEVTLGPINFTLESGRGGQGVPMWTMRNWTQEQRDRGDMDQIQTWTGKEAETQAREAWKAVTNDAPIFMPDDKQTKPFIKSLVGVCNGAG